MIILLYYILSSYMSKYELLDSINPHCGCHGNLVWLDAMEYDYM